MKQEIRYTENNFQKNSEDHMLILEFQEEFLSKFQKRKQLDNIKIKTCMT